MNATAGDRIRDAAALRCESRPAVDLGNIADLLAGVFDGALVVGRVRGDQAAPTRQVRLYREFVSLLFAGESR